MTFLEKFQKEHPELTVKTWSDIPPKYFGNNAMCPKHLGYETLAEGAIACEKHNCNNCWNREIPIKPTEPTEPDNKLIPVWLTKHQCENLADFIDSNLFTNIRNDMDIDSIYWLIDIALAYHELKKAIEQ